MNRKEDKERAHIVKKTGGRNKSPLKLPSWIKTTKRKANNAKRVSSKEKEFRSETLVRATQSKTVTKNQTEGTHILKDDTKISMNASAVTGLSSNEQFSVTTEGADKKALNSLIWCAIQGEYINCRHWSCLAPCLLKKTKLDSTIASL